MGPKYIAAKSAFPDWSNRRIADVGRRGVFSFLVKLAGRWLVDVRAWEAALTGVEPGAVVTPTIEEAMAELTARGFR
jgi:hypothetical protein